MEVHHHSHTERKKLTQYLWEFLMLFLAVFCGFLAEYQLEHMIERSKEKQFMRSMIEDLKADTANIAILKKQRNTRLQMSDSLCTAIIEKRYRENGAVFYYYGRNVSRRSPFFSADGTMQQLKNSGGLRLIHKQAVSDSIMRYDYMVKEIEEQKDDLYNANKTVTTLVNQIFDLNTPNSAWIDRSLIHNPGKMNLLSKTPEKLGELFNSILGFKINSVIYCNMQGARSFF